MAFGDGQVANNGPQLFSTLPDIPGPTSNWDVIEWAKDEYLQPTAMVQDDPSTANALLGTAAYSWSTPDGESALQAYQTTNGSWIYGLTASGGTLSAAGGANLFLSATASTVATFASPITYTVDARIAQASIAYFNSTAAATGAVLAQVFTGFVATFNAPTSATYDSSLPTWTAFLQIPISVSGTATPGALYDNVEPSSTGGGTIIYSHLLPGESALAYQTDSGDLHTLSYNLNAHLSDMIAQSGLGAAEQDMSRWTLGSMYIGLETQTASSLQSDTAAQGSLTVSLDVGDISVVQDTSQTYTYQAPASTSGGAINIVSPTTSLSASTGGTSSAGSASAAPTAAQTSPVATASLALITGIDQNTGAQLASVTNSYDLSSDNDNLTLTSQAPGAVITAGEGSNTIQTAGSNNVMISGGMLTQLINGTGTNNIDFLNTQNQTVAWDAVANFQAGDAIAIIGAGARNVFWNDITGSASSNFSGLTMMDFSSGSGGERAAFLSLPGITQADMAAGKVVVAFGTDPANGLPFALIVHA